MAKQERTYQCHNQKQMYTQSLVFSTQYLVLTTKDYELKRQIIHRIRWCGRESIQWLQVIVVAGGIATGL